MTEIAMTEMVKSYQSKVIILISELSRIRTPFYGDGQSALNQDSLRHFNYINVKHFKAFPC